MVLTSRLTAHQYYDRDAEGFAARYDALSFEAVYSLLSRYLPTHGRALDVGARSGRDARAKTAQGLPVTAVEPSDGLRANSAEIRWTENILPRLARLSGEKMPAAPSC